MESREGHSENSDQEGFYANKIEIRQEDISNLSLVNWSKMLKQENAFQSKFVPIAGIFRKQPTQSTINQGLISHEEISSDQIRKRKKLRQGAGSHPYPLYVKNQKYRLVYSRKNGQPILNEPYFLRNTIKLEHVGNPQAKAEKQIPDFQDRKNDCYYPNEPPSHILKLDSRFESGNLCCAYKNKEDQQYILFIQNDTNSLGYNQWFYFSVENNKANQIYTFRLVNLKKKQSFFRNGARPFVFSKREKQQSGEGWKKRGFNIYYEESPIQVEDTPQIQYYCLSFDVKFKYQNDCILIAMSLPYSYTKLTNLMKQIAAINSNQESQGIKVQINSICKSTGGNDIPQITISKQTAKEKQILLIMARQHPGQVWSSYMAEGMIRYLLNLDHGSSKHKRKYWNEGVDWILENYIIKIYPMINVDGVIYGNFRCDLTGSDLNRKWKDTSKVLHPQVYIIKQKIRNYLKSYKIACCLDLHGHSKNYNIFCYSCKKNQYTCRILPMMIQEKNPMFYYPSCTFGLSKYKESTARAAIFHMIKNQNVLTIQTSFYGSRIDGKVTEFSPIHVEKMGQDILACLRSFLDPASKKYKSLKKQIELNIKKYLEYDQLNQGDSGSESDPEGDEIDLNSRITDLFDQKFVNQNCLEMDEKTFIVDQKIEVSQSQKILEPKIEEVQTKDQNFDIKIQEKPIDISPRIRMNSKRFNRPLLPKREKVNQTPKRQARREAESPLIKFPDKKPKDKPDYMEFKIKKSLARPSQLFDKKNELEQGHQTKKEVQLKLNIYSSLHQNRIKRMSLQTQQLPPTEMNIATKTKQDAQEKFKTLSSKVNSGIKISHRMNGDLFDQSIYNEDQSSLISILLSNKRRIEGEKQRRTISHQVSSKKGRFRWHTGEKSQRMKKLFDHSGSQLATIIDRNKDKYF